MIPREILKTIQQIKLRTNRLVNGFASRGCARIPKGFRPKAQGCEARATLGHCPARITNRNAVAALPFASVARGIGHNPVGVDKKLIPFTQGSSCVATLGCMIQSRWDCPNRIATETLAGISFQPPPQFRRIPRTVENGNHGEDIVLDCEVNAVCLEPFQADFAGAAPHFAKEFRLKHRPIHRTKSFGSKFLSQTRRFIFIPRDGLEEFGLGFRLEEGIQMHHQPKRSRISALTCSKGIPRRGFFSISVRRRSVSAIF